MNCNTIYDLSQQRQFYSPVRLLLIRLWSFHVAHGDRNDDNDGGLYDPLDDDIYRGNDTWVYDAYCTSRGVIIISLFVMPACMQFVVKFSYS
jgi:hypothetical protein